MAKAPRPYKQDAAQALAQIERRRKAAGVPLALLAGEAGLSERTLRRALASGLAWKRQVNALAMAMRTFERETSGHDEAFPCA